MNTIQGDDKDQIRPKKYGMTLWFGTFAIIAGILISYLSYFQTAFAPFSSFLAIGALVFWAAILGVCFSLPLRQAGGAFLSYIRMARGLLVYVVYTSLHLLVYGIILETIVADVYPSLWDVPVQSGIVLSSQPLYPLSALTLAADLFFNPNIVALIPPIFDISLSLYSIAMAIIIGVLVQVNVMKTIEMRKAFSRVRKSTVFLALPIIGVVGGASCCLSLPLFVTLLAAPTVSLASPSVIGAYFLTYFLFPPGTAVILKLNLDAVNRISRTFKKGESTQA